MRLSHSGRAFHIAYGTQAQEAFLEGHVLAFQHVGGVFVRMRYDNLKTAVSRILKGRDSIRMPWACPITVWVAIAVFS